MKPPGLRIVAGVDDLLRTPRAFRAKLDLPFRCHGPLVLQAGRPPDRPPRPPAIRQPGLNVIEEPDFLSGGRTVFVACQGQAEPGGGAFEKEFADFGIEPSSRMRRIEEAIEILRLTSSREDVDYNGQYWRFRSLTVLPRPVRPLRAVQIAVAV